MSQKTPNKKEAEILAAEFVEHGNKTKAVRACWPDIENTTKKNQNEKAVLAFKSAKVQQRITELEEISKELAEKEFKMSSSDLQKSLALVIQKGLSNKVDAQGNKIAQNLSATVSAIAEVNRMNGNHAPAKVDLKSSDGSMSPVKELTNEELSEEMKKYGLEQD